MPITNIDNSKSNLPANGSLGEKRRRRILSALHDCIIKKGYAKTTLADIADVAEMYPSHLLYYYKGKDSILEHYFKNVAEKILVRIDGFRNETPERQIELLTELFFAGKGITKSEIGFMLECFGVAVNDKALRQQKSKLDEKCKAYLAELFEKTPRAFLANAKDSAEIAYSLLLGLRTAIYFDENLSLEEATRIFHTTMLNMTGIAPAN